jgi:hypothetical protein
VSPIHAEDRKAKHLSQLLLGASGNARGEWLRVVSISTNAREPGMRRSR